MNDNRANVMHDAIMIKRIIQIGESVSLNIASLYPIAICHDLQKNNHRLSIFCLAIIHQTKGRVIQKVGKVIIVLRDNNSSMSANNKEQVITGKEINLMKIHNVPIIEIKMRPPYFK